MTMMTEFMNLRLSVERMQVKESIINKVLRRMLTIGEESEEDVEKS